MHNYRIFVQESEKTELKNETKQKYLSYNIVIVNFMLT